MSEISAFLDCNGFIQLRDLKDLNWRQVFSSVQVIRLLVSSAIIDELDVLKMSPNRRRRDRARAALQLIDIASQAADFTKVLREQPVRVELVIANDPAPDWAALPKLDPARADDKLVADAVTHGNGAVLISHDTGPRIRARLVGLPAFAPHDDWLLAPEQTDDQRKLAALERELQHARNARPQIAISAEELIDGVAVLGSLRPPKLSEIAVQTATKLFLARFSMAQIHTVPAALKAFQVDEYISEYRANKYYEDYGRFNKKVTAYFASLNDRVRLRSALLPVRILVRNTGSISAKDMTFSASVSEGYEMLRQPDGENISPILSVMHPEAPARPIGDRMEALQDQLRLIDTARPPHSFFEPRPTDATAVTWLERPQMGARNQKRVCMDFRPDREWRPEVWLWPINGIPSSGELHATVGAEHHPNVSVSIAVRSEDREAAWDEAAVLELLPEPVATVMRNLNAHGE